MMMVVLICIYMLHSYVCVKANVSVHPRAALRRVEVERLVRFFSSIDLSPIPNAQDQDIVAQDGIDHSIVTHAHLA